MKTDSALKRLKVLVVGSEPAIVISLRTMLAVRSVNVLTADSPDVAIHLAQTTNTDIPLALIDVCTIDMEPRALAERLRAERPGLKILFFSSLVDGEVIRLGIIDPEDGALKREGVIQAIENALCDIAQPVMKSLAAGSSFLYSMV